ncbi:MAG TPA: hypothetical protein VM942_08025 [Acidimicrobiales bacterium]|nr:hypothetical protein [Acidimicrobiales bacterium]
MEMNRPRLTMPAGLPPEMWAVIGLLVISGLFTGIPVLRALPAAVELLTSGGIWESVGPLILVLLLELGLVAAACFVLAWLLSQGDPVARGITVVVSGSLAFGILAGDVLDGTSALVTLVCSVAAVVGLTVVPSIRELFAARRPLGDVPASVLAAEVLVVVLSALLVAVGVAYLALATVETRFAVVGLALVGISVVAFRVRQRLQTGDPSARTLISGLMAGYVAAILLGTDGSFTGPLFIPLAVVVSVVALLWVPQDSHSFFGGGLSVRRPGGESSTYPEEAHASDANGTGAGSPLASGAPNRPTTPPPPPAPESYAPDRRPPAPRPQARRATAPAPAPAPVPVPAPPRAQASPRSASMPQALTPPGWLLEAPPPGFWPQERRRAEPRQYEVVDIGPQSPDDLQVAPRLGIRFDTTSWFPTLEGRDQVRGAYLVSMVMFDDTAADTAFRGTSTLLVTSSRLLGVCPRGESADGPLDPVAGRVAVWSVVLDQVDWLQAEGPGGGGHLTLKAWDSDGPWALLAKPRVAADGAFHPTGLSDLADVVNRAKQSSA